MRLHRLEITAFGPFGTRQTVDFDTLSSAGLFLLHGPTGAGKTSVLDAVCFALYGSVPGVRQSPGTSLRSDHAPVGTYTEVLLELTVGDRRLEITRRPAQQRPKKRGGGFTTEKAQTWLREYDPATGTWAGLSRSHQEIGEEITQLVGMSREQFCQVVLLPQGDFAKFLRADAEARGKLLGRLFDTRRFAAVEERLADLRRAAEQQVRDGDERLLTLAHRMTQAAGGLEAARTPVEGRPGDPGLAESVLTWAAVARTEAREALDITGVRLAAAERGQGSARAALDAEKELADRQARHADALRRREQLTARAPERDRHQAALDRSLKAERVAPALGLRTDAEREHAGAHAARERSRALLPPDLADQGAEHLSALEHRLRGELGGLDAARRAERRSAALAEERTALAREARADEDALQDAAGWLADWEPRRTALAERVLAATDAAARAEHLAGRLEPARRRLAAARRRDALERDTTAAEARLTDAREHRNTAHETWLDVKSRRLQGIAAELAATLAEGEACQVCGATAHPAPARTTADHVDRATEDAAYAAYTRADESRTAAERELAVTREAWSAARAEVLSAASGPVASDLSDTPEPAAGVDPTVDELTREVEELTRLHGEAHALAGQTHSAREALARAEREYEERVAAQREAERRTAARTSRREALEGEQATLDEELVRGRGAFGSVAEHATRLERKIAVLVEAAKALGAAELAAQRLKEADDRLADAAYRAGFATPAEARDALVGEAERRDLQRRVDAWQAEAAAVADRLAEPGTAAAAALPPADPAAAEAAHTAAERRLRQATSDLAAARDRATGLTGLSRQASTEVHRLGPLREEYDRVARLAALTAGTSAENERRMRLESYVLAARLEQVAAAATARLQRMSSGRYTLVHSDARSGGKRAGLGLHVVDAWTGNERDTATLSGGETFFASLALALGLADVVTEEAGGVRLDTLFIDEGFGSLDEQTLDEVLDVLDSLRERDRSVGIVSHVGDLRRRIPAQLEVVKARHGSAVRLRTGGDALSG
ncbi:Exonuclease SbcC [Streptomyces venezuelae]|uniref:AAA family ATPase n=1 Tax=Streptomyces gardneri TaxID=66892 RepID=UPI0006BCFD53|nr:SMC family ATPase [Streptomyces gardneri]ALO06869.1 Exonuclease SbcC [Streptomyces venezuelae]QPK44251.1 SMC family ATPase [Streptomyces gardneri]WRK35535.1 SMC family ATPase [Streptomyces venezuelae]CUM42836.1 Exonuclease SbcC [Streptomyces venezuelae]